MALLAHLTAALPAEVGTARAVGVAGVLGTAGPGTALLVSLLGRRLPAAAAGPLTPLRLAAGLVVRLLARRGVPRSALRRLTALLSLVRSLLSALSLLSLTGTAGPRGRLRAAAPLRATALLSLSVLFVGPSSVGCVTVSHEYHRCFRARVSQRHAGPRHCGE